MIDKRLWGQIRIPFLVFLHLTGLVYFYPNYITMPPGVENQKEFILKVGWTVFFQFSLLACFRTSVKHLCHLKDDFLRANVARALGFPKVSNCALSKNVNFDTGFWSPLFYFLRSIDNRQPGNAWENAYCTQTNTFCSTMKIEPRRAVNCPQPWPNECGLIRQTLKPEARAQFRLNFFFRFNQYFEPNLKKKPSLTDKLNKHFTELRSFAAAL